ncbi:hypothetical protein TPAR_03012, partial [Tolypocladium paradoxum]
LHPHHHDIPTDATQDPQPPRPRPLNRPNSLAQTEKAENTRAPERAIAHHGPPHRLLELLRPGRALLAGRHRDAAPLQPVVAVGVPGVRARRRELRALAAGRRRPAGGDAGRAQGAPAGEAGAQGAAGRRGGGGGAVV